MCSACFFEWADHWRAEAQARVDSGESVVSDALCPSCREPVITFGVLKSLVVPGDSTGGPLSLRLYLASREQTRQPVTVLDVSILVVILAFVYYVLRLLITFVL